MVVPVGHLVQREAETGLDSGAKESAAHAEQVAGLLPLPPLLAADDVLPLPSPLPAALTVSLPPVRALPAGHTHLPLSSTASTGPVEQARQSRVRAFLPLLLVDLTHVTQAGSDLVQILPVRTLLPSEADCVSAACATATSAAEERNARVGARDGDHRSRRLAKTYQWIPCARLNQQIRF